MSQATAGEMVDFMIENFLVTAKVEDASKSESILAKVVFSQSPNYKVDQVYAFDRSLLKQAD